MPPGAKMNLATGRSAAWLARLLWEQEAGGSNPPVPTSQGNLGRRDDAQAREQRVCFLRGSAPVLAAQLLEARARLEGERGLVRLLRRPRGVEAVAGRILHSVGVALLGGRVGARGVE